MRILLIILLYLIGYFISYLMIVFFLHQMAVNKISQTDKRRAYLTSLMSWMFIMSALIILAAGWIMLREEPLFKPKKKRNVLNLETALREKLL